MKASVVICTRNRSGSIAETLEAISKLNYPDFEALVVDNSDDGGKDKVAQLAAQYGCKFIHEPRRGLNVARNPYGWGSRSPSRSRCPMVGRTSSGAKGSDATTAHGASVPSSGPNGTAQAM